MDGTGMGLRKVSSHCSIPDIDDFDLSRLLDKPKLNIERKRSFDERSLSELSQGLTRAARIHQEEGLGSTLQLPQPATPSNLIQWLLRLGMLLGNLWCSSGVNPLALLLLLTMLRKRFWIMIRYSFRIGLLKHMQFEYCQNPNETTLFWHLKILSLASLLY